MTNVRAYFSPLVAVALAVAIHVDWHFARHYERLSLGWPYHWLFAIPVFSAAAWFIRRYWPGRADAVSLTSITAAAVLGQVVEPLGESLFYDAPVGQGFGAERLTAFATFMAVGVVTYTLVLWVLNRRPTAESPRKPPV